MRPIYAVAVALETSVINPKQWDLEVLPAVNSGDFGKVPADYPALTSTG